MCIECFNEVQMAISVVSDSQVKAVVLTSISESAKKIKSLIVTKPKTK